MPGIRWILAALALACPLFASAASTRLLLLPTLALDPPEALVAAQVDRHLAEAAAALGFTRVPPPDRTCTQPEHGCLVALAVAADAERVVHAELRRVGGSLALLLVGAGVGEDSLVRSSDPLPQRDALAGPLRERLLRVVAPERWVGELHIDATPGSEIWLDGERRGVTPLAAPLGGIAPGEHLLRVARAGVGEARASVEIRFGQQTRVRIEPRSDQLAVLGFVPEGTASVAAGGRERVGWLHDPLLRWTLLGAGGGALAGSAWPALDARAIAKERDELRSAGGAFPAAVQARQRDLLGRYERRRLAAVVLLGTGAVLALGAGALFLGGPGAGHADEVQVHAGPGGLGFAGRF